MIIKLIIYLSIAVLFSCTSSNVDCCKPDSANQYSTVSLFLRTYNPDISGFNSKKFGSLSKKKSLNISLDSVLIRFSNVLHGVIEERFAYEEVLIISDIPLAENWSVVVQIYDTNQTILYNGVKSSISVSNQDNSFAVDCYPEFSNIKSTFFLDSTNGVITQGKMFLIQNEDTLQLNLIKQGDLAFFRSDYLPVGHWLVQIFLYDENDNLILTGIDSFDAQKGISKQVTIELKVEQAGVQASLILKASPSLEFKILYYSSRKRLPLFKNLVISEFFPNPEKGELFEWMEIINTTADTLDVSNCQILKTHTSNAISTLVSLSSVSNWLPGDALVFGRDSVQFRDIDYLFRLTNTKQSILLLCDGVLIDSVSYTSVSVNTDVIYVESNFIASKDHRFYTKENNNNDWCVSQNQSNNLISTPSKIISGCNK